MAEVLLEDNWVGSSPQPLSLGYGITGLYGRANSFPPPPPFDPRLYAADAVHAMQAMRHDAVDGGCPAAAAPGHATVCNPLLAPAEGAHISVTHNIVCAVS
eukprot:gene12781-8650_t